MSVHQMEEEVNVSKCALTLTVATTAAVRLATLCQDTAVMVRIKQQSNFELLAYVRVTKLQL